jgi:hypothetical protein
MPYLDWFGCLHLNMVLDEKIISQIHPVKLTQMTMLVNLTNIKRAILKVERAGIISEMHYWRGEKETERRWAILEMFEIMEQNLTITQHHKNFRETTFEKIDAVTAEAHKSWANMPEPFLNRCNRIFASLQTTITEKYPFLHYLELPSTDWSAVY